ncbi:hypothetical protein ALC57_12899 [Trachymyrmex cornetzi]|uniref:Uncharacterized protein n=1 Tax=Trachymyrmex cornetzi TaxID=471704 RepID=A0A151J0L4_9HYME|nr:hypothetical protein ALC57_12899 [Trachymyrmex cornetzi]
MYTSIRLPDAFLISCQARENGSSSSSRYDKNREGRRLWHSCFVEPSNPTWTGTGCCETEAPTTIALLAFRIYRGPSNGPLILRRLEKPEIKKRNMRRYTYRGDKDTESSSPGRQKATGAGPACIPQLHEAEERSHLAPQPERIYTRPYDTSHGVPYPYSITHANDVTEGASFFRGLAASNLSAVFLPLDFGHQRSCCLIDYPPTRGLKEPSARKHEKRESKTNEK